MELNFEAAREAFARMAQCLGITEEGSAMDRALLQAVRKLQRAVGVRGGLASMGVHRSSIPSLARTAMNDACIVTNPRTPSVGDLEEILERAL